MLIGGCGKVLVLLETLLLASFLTWDVVHAAELVMFEREGCSWCRRWDADVGSIYEKTDEARLLPLRRVNIDAGDKSDIVLERPVRYTPTFIVVDRGHEVGRITGYMADGAFWGLLGKLVVKIESRQNREN